MTGTALSRRTVLAFAGLTVGTATMYLGTASAEASSAALDTTAITLEPLPGSPVTVFSANPYAVMSFPRQLAVRVHNGGATLPSGARFEVAFDPRVYASPEAVSVTMNGRLVTDVTATDPTMNPSTGVTSRAITINQPIPTTTREADALIIVLGVAKPLTYPFDLVRTPGAVSSEIPAHGAKRALAKKRTFSGSPKTAELARLPWGISLSAFWNRQTWGENDRFVYYYPAQVTVHSVGPAAVPTAAAFTVSIDPQVVADLEPTFLRLNDKQLKGTVKRLGTTRSEFVFETTWQTPIVLKAGDVLEVGFAGTVLKPTGPLPTIKHPVITLTAMDRDSRQRETGTTTVARLDSIWLNE